MKENKVKHHSHRKSGFTFGVILILIGALFLAFNFGFLEGGFKRVVFSWQMLLILIGLLSMFHKHIFSGLACIAIGGFFIVPRLAVACPDTFYWVEVDFVRTYWPILLIVGGLLILLHIIIRPKRYHGAHHHISEDSYYREYKKTKDGHHSGMDKNSVFSNVEEIVLDPEFTGGEINAVFGNIVLDLRKTNLPEGKTVLEVNAVFGGITVYVPETWDVELHLDNVFGGFNDIRNRILTDEVDKTRKLIIMGSCVFGGGEIRN